MKYVLPCLCIIIISACAYRVDKTSSQEKFESNQMKSTLTFELIKNSVLEAKCIKCHSNETRNAGNTNLETYQNVLASLQEMKDDILNGKMPKAPGKPLSTDEKSLLLGWIKMGAPETAGAPPAKIPIQQPIQPGETDAPIPGLEPTFSSINNLIIKTKCIDCHDTDEEDNDILLRKYSDIISEHLVMPETPEKSSLIRHIVLGASRKIMPPEGSKYRLVAPEDVEIIKQWIAEGARNN